ncbi:DMT family transporter, partial [Pseudomonas aeruginosa]|uniref:DMT family transporter n=1 Tax=Pseudomonas aeruginosa TaxID=287 RepID=UPI003FD03CF5
TPTPSRTPTKKSCGRCRNSSTKRETSHVDRLTEISGFPAYNPAMGWIYLVLAGLFEIGWPVGLKMAQEPTSRWSGVAVAVSFMTISGAFLWLAQRQIPIGTAYAVWTGIGAAGTFLVGIHFYGDPTSLMRYLGVALIILGVITLKLSS